ncbi:MAG: GIN domain-containing protein [Bacteroidota bacterium]
MRLQESFLLFIPLLFMACGEEAMHNCTRSYGRDSVRYQRLEGVRSMEVGQEFDVYLTQDSSHEEGIRFVYGSKLLNGLRAEVQDGKLLIRDINRCNWTRSMKGNPRCTLNLHRLDEIHLRGAASLQSLDTLRGSSLLLSQQSVYDARLNLQYGNVYGGSNNSGKTILRGFAGIFAYEVNDAGQLLAEDLMTEDIYLFYYSPLDARVRARQWLQISLHGYGNVQYMQEPIRGSQLNATGSGRILKGF